MGSCPPPRNSRGLPACCHGSKPRLGGWTESPHPLPGPGGQGRAGPHVNTHVPLAGARPGKVGGEPQESGLSRPLEPSHYSLAREPVPFSLQPIRPPGGFHSQPDHLISVLMEGQYRCLQARASGPRPLSSSLLWCLIITGARELAAGVGRSASAIPAAPKAAQPGPPVVPQASFQLSHRGRKPGGPKHHPETAWSEESGHSHLTTAGPQNNRIMSQGVGVSIPV